MSQTQRQPSLNYYPTSYQTNYSVDLNRIKSNIRTGAVITASDINTLGTLLNSWSSHYHTYTDVYSLATFGNTGNRNTLSESKNSSLPRQTNGGSLSAWPGTTTVISQQNHNHLRNVWLQLYSHHHVITDRTS
jgi:hypothetical protein